MHTGQKLTGEKLMKLLKKTQEFSDRIILPLFVMVSLHVQSDKDLAIISLLSVIKYSNIFKQIPLYVICHYFISIY